MCHFDLIAFARILSRQSLAADPVPASPRPHRPNRTPVLVELFTSEGCSSCPPADALLAKLDHEQPVSERRDHRPGRARRLLGRPGWHDRFSSHQYTDRQSQYSSHLQRGNDVYTPQMIVDGTDQFVGNDAPHALMAIKHAALERQDPAQALPACRSTVARSQHPSPSPLLPARSRRQTSTPRWSIPRHDRRPRRRKWRPPAPARRRRPHPASASATSRISTPGRLVQPQRPADAKPGEHAVVVFAQQSGQGAVLGADLRPT